MTWLIISFTFHVLIKAAIAFEDNHVVKEFKNIQYDFGKWKMSVHPEYGTMIDVDGFNDKLGSVLPADFDKVKVTADAFLSRLRRLPYEKMPNETQIDYDILQHTIMTLLDGYQWRFYGPLNTVSFLDGPVGLPDMLVEHTPFSNKGDFVNFLERFKVFPTMVVRHIERLKLAVSNNHTHHAVSMAKVKEQFQKIFRTRPEHYILYKPFNDSLVDVDTLPGPEKSSYRNSARTWIKRIIDAYRRLNGYIEKTYKHHLRTGLGVSSWENGREFYKAVLKWHLTVDVTPRQVNDLGIREVKRIKEKMIQILRRTGYHGTIREYTTFLKGHPSYTVSSTNTILNFYRDIVKDQIEPMLPRLFKNIPNLPLRVAPSLEDGPFAGYRAGSRNGLKPGLFYVNLFRPTDVSVPDFMPIALHQAIPGHHLQSSIQSLAYLPIFRRRHKGSQQYFQAPFDFPDYSVFAEGWALYAEALGESMRLYRDDYSILGRYSSELFRACLLVVDTGIHYYSWSKDRAVDYLMTHSTFGLELLENVVDQIVTWPGQACGAKIGEMKIWELRRRAQYKLRRKFDIREFHSELLRHGDVPLKALEKIVDNWITRTANSSLCGSSPSLAFLSLPKMVALMVILLFIV